MGATTFWHPTGSARRVSPSAEAQFATRSSRGDASPRCHCAITLRLLDGPAERLAACLQVKLSVETVHSLSNAFTNGVSRFRPTRFQNTRSPKKCRRGLRRAGRAWKRTAAQGTVQSAPDRKKAARLRGDWCGLFRWLLQRSICSV